MKATIRTILCAAAFMLAAVSCQKSAEPVQPIEEGIETIDISVNGLMGEYTQRDGIKSSLVNTVRVAWAAGDVVYVFENTKYLGKLTAALDKRADETDEDRYAKLSGTINTPSTTPCSLILVHSPLMTEPAYGEEIDGVIIDMGVQNTAKVPFVAYATMDYTGESISEAIVPFKFASSVIKVNCTGLKANSAITSATLSNVNTLCGLQFSQDDGPIVMGGVPGTITRTGDADFIADKVNAEGEAVFQIAVPALDATHEARILEVIQGGNSSKDKNFSTNFLPAATSVNTVCQMVPLPAGSLPGEFSVDGNGKTVHFAQGNLWYGSVDYTETATFNFETNQYDFVPDYGSGHISHFFWSKSKEEAVKETYGDDGWSDSDVFFTNEGETTAKEDFTVNVEGKERTGWRTLSSAEWVYLFNTPARMINDKPCYSNAMSGVSIEDITYKGVFLYPDKYNGDVVSSSMTWNDINAAGIVFLPAAGKRDGSNGGHVDGGCLYWTSSACPVGYAYGVAFLDEEFHPGNINCYRYNGFSVRLITEQEQ